MVTNNVGDECQPFCAAEPGHGRIPTFLRRRSEKEFFKLFIYVDVRHRQKSERKKLFVKMITLGLIQP